MPIYEFQCTDCKEVFEEMVPVGKKTYVCPVCGSKAKKIISQVGIIFKGTGWYCTDSRKPSTNGNGKKKVEAVPDVSDGTEKTTTETKSAKTTKKSDS